jgi:hypothetical protein
MVKVRRRPQVRSSAPLLIHNRQRFSGMLSIFVPQTLKYCWTGTPIDRSMSIAQSFVFSARRAPNPLGFFCFEMGPPSESFD